MNSLVSPAHKNLRLGAYGRKLTTLLGKGWEGPHGFYVSWIIRGEHFGYKTRAIPTYRDKQPSKVSTHNRKPVT